MLLVYKYLQSFYYLSVKSDALNPTLSIEAPPPNFRYYLIYTYANNTCFTRDMGVLSHVHAQTTTCRTVALLFIN